MTDIFLKPASPFIGEGAITFSKNLPPPSMGEGDHVSGGRGAASRQGGRRLRASMNAAFRRPPLVPVGTTFPPQAGAQQGSARHFLYKLLHSKHGLFCSHFAGKETVPLKPASPICGEGDRALKTCLPPFMGEGDREAVEGGAAVRGESAFIGRPGANFARLAHPMQDGHSCTMNTCQWTAYFIAFPLNLFSCTCYNADRKERVR